MTYDSTSEADSGPHVCEHVAHGDGADALDICRRQMGGITDLEHPQRQHDDGANDQLSGTDAPRKISRSSIKSQLGVVDATCIQRRGEKHTHAYTCGVVKLKTPTATVIFWCATLYLRRQS